MKLMEKTGYLFMCAPRDATNFIVTTHQFTNHKSLFMLLFIKWNMFPQLGVVTTGPPHSGCSAAQRLPIGKSGCFFPVLALLFCCTKVKLFIPLLILPDIYNYWLFPFWLWLVYKCCWLSNSVRSAQITGCFVRTVFMAFYKHVVALNRMQLISK